MFNGSENFNGRYYQQYGQNVRNLSIDYIQKVSRKVEDQNAVNWFMVGERARIAEKLGEQGFDNIIEIDANGNPIVPSIITPKPEIKN